MESVWLDLRQSLRALRAAPAFWTFAVLTLGLGIGINTAVFSAVNALLLGPLPVPEGERLVYGIALREGFDPFGTSPLEYSAYRDRSRTLEQSGLALHRVFTLTRRGDPEQLRGAAVMLDFMTTIGVEPATGRAFLPGEDRSGAAVALLSHEVWQGRFGANPDAIGQTLLLDDRPYTVVGIMPRGFDLPARTQVWVPLQLNADALPLEQQNAHNYTMFARLRPGATIQAADAELKALARQLEQEHPALRRGWSFTVIPLRDQLMGDLSGRTRRGLLALVAAVGCLLLICCANVASLLLVRLVRRERDVAVRLALGAGRVRIVRQLVLESVTLASMGGAAGVFLAMWIAPILRALNPIHAESLASVLTDFRIDTRVLLFASGLSLVTGVTFGMIPAIRVGRTGDVLTTLRKRETRAGGTAGRRWLGAVVVAEVAVAATLLVSGSLVVQSFYRLQRVDLGFRPDHLVMLQMPLSPTRFAEHRERAQFADEVVRRVRALPGVERAGVTTNAPLDTASIDAVFTVEGRALVNPADVPITAHRLVSGEYLQTIGVTLLAGRLIDARDGAGAMPVAIVSEELARQAWPGVDPIGKRIRRGRADQTSFPWLTVVGVVADVKEDRFNFRVPRAVWYLPYAQQDNTWPLTLLVRTGVDPAAVASAVRREIHTVNPDQPIGAVTTITEHVRGVVATERFSAVLMATLAASGLLLAVLGLYGVIAYSVAQRTGEIGLRMALGSRSRDVFVLVMRHAAVLIAGGLSVGLMSGVLMAHWLSSTLFGVSPTDPSTVAAVGVLLTIVGLAASFVPARRAIRIDPLAALRDQN